MAELSPAPRRPARRPRYPRRLRRALPALLMIAVLSALAGGVWWRILERAGADPAAAACPAGAYDPQAVRVRVYNASLREGLARAVAGQLGRRGFVVVSTANDPLIDLRPITTGWAEIRYGPAGTKQAQLLRAHVPGAKLFRDGRTDAVVDVAVGPAYKRLANAAEVDRAMAALRAASARAVATGPTQAVPRQGIAAGTAAPAGGSPAPAPAGC